jgi:hypothetical protein
MSIQIFIKGKIKEWKQPLLSVLLYHVGGPKERLVAVRLEANLQLWFV